MDRVIEEKDLKIIEKIAKSYNMSADELSREIIRQNMKKGKRQFRVSEDEYNVILEKAKEKEMTVRNYCEHACNHFIHKKEFNKFWEYKRYGANRTKRITMRFKNVSDEEELMKISREMSVEISSLIRWCALNYA